MDSNTIVYQETLPREPDASEDTELLHRLLAEMDGRAIMKRQWEMADRPKIELPPINPAEWTAALKADVQANLPTMVIELWKHVFPTKGLEIRFGSTWRATDDNDLPSCQESESSDE